MKFIKTADGWYISQNNIDAFNIIQPDKNRADVCAWIDETRWALKRFSCDPKSTTQFDPKDAAQAWLDNLINELNGGNSQ